MKQGWEIKKIRDICDKASSNIVQNKILELDGDYPVYGASGYVQNVDFFHRDSPYIGIVKDGAGVGRVNIYPAYSSLLGTLQYIIPKDGYLLEYVAYALKGLNLASYASGATIPHIYFKNYGETEISVAPLPEQEKIVAELDCLSGIIEKKKQQLKEYDVLAQSIFYEMFGNPIDNEKGWEVKKLGEVSEVTSFKRVLIEDVVESGIPFIRGTELSALSKLPNSKDYQFTLFITHEHYERVKAISGVPKIGDLLIPSINSEGLIWELDTDEPRYYKDGRVLWIHTNHQYSDSKTLKYIISNKLRLMYRELASGATFIELKLFVLRDMLLPFPPLSLQQEFASKIEAIEKQKELIKQSIAETETLFNSRMDYYFN